MKKTTFLLTVLAAASWMAGSSVAMAVNVRPRAVVIGDTYSFDLVAFNTVGGSYYITQQLTATFGATTTFTGAGYNGQNITITSSETVGVTTTTDTFTISTPTNFLTQDSINGTFINGIQFDLGDVNSGGDTVAVLLPIGSYTATGSVLYGTTTTASLTPTTMLGAGDTSYSMAEGVNTASQSNSINSFTVHGFTYSITYPTLVPEPSTWAMLGLGAFLGVGVIFRRRLAA